MTWLTPAWLAAIGAVLLPILLHLRDRTPPDVIRVGSVADLGTAATVRRRARLDDIPLLLLRCLVVTLLAMLLAGPRVGAPSGGGVRIAVVPSGLDALADSIARSGVVRSAVFRSPHPWSMAVWADTAIARDDTLVLVLPATGQVYRGTRPVLRHHVIPVFAPEPAPAPDTLRVAVVAANASWVAARDTVVARLNALPAFVPVRMAAPGERAQDTLYVGQDQRAGLDSLSLARGALDAAGFIDSLVTRLIPPRPALDADDRVPTIASGAVNPSPGRDARALAWWMLVAMIGAERWLAARRVT